MLILILSVIFARPASAAALSGTVPGVLGTGDSSPGTAGSSPGSVLTGTISNVVTSVSSAVSPAGPTAAASTSQSAAQATASSSGTPASGTPASSTPASSTIQHRIHTGIQRTRGSGEHRIEHGRHRGEHCANRQPDDTRALLAGHQRGERRRPERHPGHPESRQQPAAECPDRPGQPTDASGNAVGAHRHCRRAHLGRVTTGAILAHCHRERRRPERHPGDKESASGAHRQPSRRRQARWRAYRTVSAITGPELRHRDRHQPHRDWRPHRDRERPHRRGPARGHRHRHRPTRVLPVTGTSPASPAGSCPRSPGPLPASPAGSCPRSPGPSPASPAAPSRR